jgi:amidohydrolase
MSIVKKIKTKVEKLNGNLIEMRRHLHQHPELSFAEKETSQYVQGLLSEHGIKYKAGYCKYGIVAEIKGAQKGGLVYLRGDMDALPITEENKVPYASKRSGVMHACGHDAHTTMLLGAAITLQSLRTELKGTYRFVFQPGEEQLPGGASIMIKEGAIKNPSKAKIFGQHVHPPLEAGKVGFHPGEYMASADEIFIEVVGKGGHAALPLNFIDPVMVSAEVVSALHKIISRYSDPKVPAVLSFGKINSKGGATNIIPESVSLMGTLRTMDETNRAHLKKMIKQIATHTAKAYGAKARVKIKHGYPTLKNDIPLTTAAMGHAEKFLGKENVVLLDKRMTAEDFSFYTQMVPACFYRLGTGNQRKGMTSPVHTPTFDIDESALAIGVGLMSYLATQNI